MIKKAQQQQRNTRIVTRQQQGRNRRIVVTRIPVQRVPTTTGRASSQKVSLRPANERKNKNDLQNSVCMKNENTTAPLFVHFD